MLASRHATVVLLLKWLIRLPTKGGRTRTSVAFNGLICINKRPYGWFSFMRSGWSRRGQPPRHSVGANAQSCLFAGAPLWWQQHGQSRLPPLSIYRRKFKDITRQEPGAGFNSRPLLSVFRNRVTELAALNVSSTIMSLTSYRAVTPLNKHKRA